MEKRLQVVNDYFIGKSEMKIAEKSSSMTKTKQEAFLLIFWQKWRVNKLLTWKRYTYVEIRQIAGLIKVRKRRSSPFFWKTKKSIPFKF